MGAFLLCKSNTDEDFTLGLKSFRDIGFDPPKEIKIGSYTLYIFKKLFSKESISYYTSDNASVNGIGTYVYKGLSKNQSCEALLKDFVNSTFDHSRLIGHYFIFLVIRNNFYILNDSTSLITAYHDCAGNFLTSSFIAGTAVLEKLSLDKQTIIENLVTGGITGNDTEFNELKRFSKKSIQSFPDVEFCFPELKESEILVKTRKQALESQAEGLKGYFKDCKPLADELGVDTGITGGFDSRLLLGCLVEKFNKIQVHSHYRNELNIDWEIARTIAENINIPFVSPVVRSFGTFSDNELSETLESAFSFYDAQIRMHCNWNEEYNTLEYRLKVLRGKSLGFHGIGGEQYRNQDRLCLRSWDVGNWLKYKIIRKTGGNVFKDPEYESSLIEKMKGAIYLQLGSPVYKNRITLIDLKRINNEVFIPSFRGARTSAENKVSWFLSPFADFHISSSAYSIVPFLDCSNNFEIDLIKMISPELARFTTSYGYSLERGEPFRKVFVNTLFESYIPDSVNWRIRERIKRKNSDQLFGRKISTSPLIKKCIQNVYDMDLPIKIDLLLERPDTAPMVLSMGYFLEKFNTKLS